MARIAHSIPMNAYGHIVRLLEEAGGKDGITAREDAKKLVEKLESEGRGTEALAAAERKSKTVSGMSSFFFAPPRG